MVYPQSKTLAFCISPSFWCKPLKGASTGHIKPALQRYSLMWVATHNEHNLWVAAYIVYMLAGLAFASAAFELSASSCCITHPLPQSSRVLLTEHKHLESTCIVCSSLIGDEDH
jgi:hypothetical protein